MDELWRGCIVRGTHQLELYVEDTEGATGVDSVSIQVREQMKLHLWVFRRRMEAR